MKARKVATLAPFVTQFDAVTEAINRGKAKGHGVVCCAGSVECWRCGASGSVCPTDTGAQFTGAIFTDACK